MIKKLIVPVHGVMRREEVERFFSGYGVIGTITELGDGDYFPSVCAVSGMACPCQMIECIFTINGD